MQKIPEDSRGLVHLEVGNLKRKKVSGNDLQCFKKRKTIFLFYPVSGRHAVENMSAKWMSKGKGRVVEIIPPPVIHAESLHDFF